jgi:hypothetical protein
MLGGYVAKQDLLDKKVVFWVDIQIFLFSTACSIEGIAFYAKSVKSSNWLKFANFNKIGHSAGDRHFLFKKGSIYTNKCRSPCC